MSLRDTVDKIKPNFEKGGKFSKMSSTFEAFETFLYTPNTVTKKGSHVRDAVDLKRVLITVCIALVPALIFGMYNIGYQAHIGTGCVLDDHGFWPCLWEGFLRMLPLIVVSYVVGLGIEFIYAEIRHEEVSEGYLVSGLIIPMIVPVTTPLWQLAIAVAFAVIIGKEAFGGTGMNFLNPALVARAFLFFSYPTHMSGDKVWVANPIGFGGDAVTCATPLGQCMTTTAQSGSELASSFVGCDPNMHLSLCDMFLGIMPGSTCETSTLAILLGAAILLLTGVASWRIMFSVVLGGGLMGLLFNAIGANAYMQLPFYYHFLMGGFAFGAVFMATDPVTSAQTNCGKWIYGLLIGAFAVLLRVVNPAYPEGMMLAILLMNCFAPLIDHCVVSANINRRKKRALQTA